MSRSSASFMMAEQKWEMYPWLTVRRDDDYFSCLTNENSRVSRCGHPWRKDCRGSKNALCNTISG